MAQSDDVTIDTDHTFHREALPAGEARLVLREDDVTVTFEGDEERVHQRFLEYVAESFDISVDTLEADINSYPMPTGDDGLVPADEFYEE